MAKTKREFPHYPKHWQLAYRHAMGWLVTDLVFHTHLGQVHHWNSRHHRKGLGMDYHAHIEPSLTFTGFTRYLIANLKSRAHSNAQFGSDFNLLNFLIGLSFIIGASHFILASILTLISNFSPHSLTSLYFIGSVFFTLAAYLQYFQSINSGESIHGKQHAQKKQWLAWQPHRLDFWVTFSQFIGTLLFNVNTFNGYFPFTDLELSLFIWLPNLLGSLCFQLSGSLALYETSHQFWLWSPKRLEQKMAAINHLGCLFFLGSAFSSSSAANALSPDMLTFSILLTCLGGMCFFSAAVLLCRESIQIPQHSL
ncbi:hypothetical protein [uncultured Shewanella sp.]|uniref:hypothetical protein n=1 Tax=uncultured Shewanella sp. TaxID=173975 RepID=UPI00261F7342|nr:hypothetical protein [uncultured Shewanella sp.]